MSGDDLIGIDHSGQILIRVVQRMSEQGVRYLGPEEDNSRTHVWEGMSNKRRASLAIPELSEKPSEEEAEELYEEWIGKIQEQLRKRVK